MRYPYSIRRIGGYRNACAPIPGGISRATAKLLTLFLLLGSGSFAGAQTSQSRAAAIQDHLAKGAQYLKAKDANAAVVEFNAVLALDPENAEAYTNLGVAAFLQGDYQSASRNLRRALAIDPSSTRTQALLGICQRKLGDPSARALLEKAFHKLKDKPLQLQVGLELAALYEQRGDPEATAAVMRTLVDLDPDDVNVLFMAYRVYSELAYDTMNKLAVLAPGSARMQQVIAQNLVNAGDLKGAMDHYRKALDIDPRLPGVHFELGEAILQSAPSDPGAQAEAEKEFKLAVATDGDSAKTECQFGSMAYSQSDLNAAFAHYQRAHELNPNDVSAQLGLAKILMNQDKPQEAVKYLRAAVENDPLNIEAHYRLAQAYRRVQMNAEAEKELTLVKEIKATREQVQALYNQMNIHKPQTGEIPDEK